MYQNCGNPTSSLAATSVKTSGELSTLVATLSWTIFSVRNTVLEWYSVKSLWLEVLDLSRWLEVLDLSRWCYPSFIKRWHTSGSFTETGTSSRAFSLPVSVSYRYNVNISSNRIHKLHLSFAEMDYIKENLVGKLFTPLSYFQMHIFKSSHCKNWNKPDNSYIRWCIQPVCNGM